MKTCCGCPEGSPQWDGSFDHPQQVFKLMDGIISPGCLIRSQFSCLRMKTRHGCSCGPSLLRRFFWEIRTNIKLNRFENFSRNWKMGEFPYFKTKLVGLTILSNSSLAFIFIIENMFWMLKMIASLRRFFRAPTKRC